jgi:hypothetical protein
MGQQSTGSDSSSSEGEMLLVNVSIHDRIDCHRQLQEDLKMPGGKATIKTYEYAHSSHSSPSFSLTKCQISDVSLYCTDATMYAMSGQVCHDSEFLCKRPNPRTYNHRNGRHTKPTPSRLCYPMPPHHSSPSAQQSSPIRSFGGVLTRACGVCFPKITLTIFPVAAWRRDVSHWQADLHPLLP